MTRTARTGWGTVILSLALLGSLYWFANTDVSAVLRPKPTLAATKPKAKPVMSTVQVREAIVQTVQSQLEAFRSNNYPAAYQFASVALQQRVSPWEFEQMVRTGYPAIAGCVKVQFGLAMDDGEDAVLSTTIVGPNQVPHQFQYLLRKEGAAWKVTGVLEISENLI